MAFPIIEVALGLGKTIADIVKARVPDVNVQAQIEADVQKAVMAQDWGKVEKEFADRADARALAMKESEKGNAFTMALSALVRPVWGLSSLVVVAYPYLAKPLGWPAVEIDDNTKQIIQTVIMFYF